MNPNLGHLSHATFPWVWEVPSVAIFFVSFLDFNSAETLRSNGPDLQYPFGLWGLAETSVYWRVKASQESLVKPRSDQAPTHLFTK